MSNEKTKSNNKKIKIKKDEYLYHEGDSATSFYMLVHGTLRATRIRNHQELTKMGRVVPGGIVGEMSLFDGERRLYNIKAEQDCELIEIPYSQVLNQSDEIPLWCSALTKNLIFHFKKMYPFVKNENLFEENEFHE